MLHQSPREAQQLPVAPETIFVLFFRPLTPLASATKQVDAASCKVGAAHGAYSRSKRPAWRLQGRWYIRLSTLYPLKPGLWMTRPSWSETVRRKDLIGPGVSEVRSGIGAPWFE